MAAIARRVTRDIIAPTIRDTMAGAVAAVAITVAAEGVAASVTVDAEAAADAAGAAAGAGGAAMAMAMATAAGVAMATAAMVGKDCGCDRRSRGTILYPPTPHHDRAKADNDRDQDRQDGDSCVILTLPVAEWVSWCAAGFDRHNSSDSQIESRCGQSYRNAEGEELRVSPQVDDRGRST